jgi:hypothetical protein
MIAVEVVALAVAARPVATLAWLSQVRVQASRMRESRNTS